MYTIDLSNVARYDTQNARSFVEFWGQFYVEDDIKVLDAEELIDYFTELNIANDLTEENLRRLLRWKDPRLLTHRILSGTNKGQDNARVRKVLANLGPINQFRNEQITAAEIRGTIDQVFADGVVWKAFLQHIAQPHVYPIADQNVFRVWSLHTGRKDEQTWATYDSYCDYFGQIAQAIGADRTIENIRQLKRIDDALLCFGLFLAAYWKPEKKSGPVP